MIDKTMLVVLALLLALTTGSAWKAREWYDDDHDAAQKEMMQAAIDAINQHEQRVQARMLERSAQMKIHCDRPAEIND